MDKLRNIGIVAIACLFMSLAMIGVASAQYDYPEETGLFLGGLALLTCIVPIIFFVLAIILAIWVYKDAEKRGSSGALWLIIVILTSFIGLIIWLVVRPPIGGEKKMSGDSGRTCPNCGRPIPMDARVCPYCSKKFDE